MFSNVFLALTGGEIAEPLPERVAYMALHFSPYSAGLSNAPRVLPSGSILLLDDSMPAENHDPQTVVDQLKQLIDQFSSHGILLDFQRPKTKESECMVSYILEALPCPVAVTESYATVLSSPVFLSPPPVNKALEDHLKPWLAQGIYLEIAPDALEITVTQTESIARQIPPVKTLPLEDKRLHCHYNVEVLSHKAVFTMGRHPEDLPALVAEAEQLGVLGCVGLYKELQPI